MSKETGPEALMVTVPPELSVPTLKNSCDATLQSAYYGRNWSTVINLAKQRFKATKDPYYQAVEVVARSQSDNPLDRGAGRDIVSSYVADPNAVINDGSGLDLYEYACADGRANYSETIGVLRSRLVKAMPKDQTTSIACLNACIYHSDWLHAQEITASMEKNFPNVKKYRMYNIFTTNMYTATPYCPEKSKNLLATIAKRKADKELEARGLLISSNDLSAPLSATDEELKLWAELQDGTHVNRSETIATLQKFAFRLLDYRNEFLFAQVLDRLLQLRAWDEAAELCEHVLDRAISISQKAADTIDETQDKIQKRRRAENKKKAAELKTGGGQTPSAQIPDNSTANDAVVDEDEPDEDVKELSDAAIAIRAQRSEDDRTYLRVGMRPRLWTILIECASNKPNRGQLLKQTRRRLERLMKALERSYEAKDLQYSDYNEAMLRIAFLRGRDSTDSASDTVGHILYYIMEYHMKFPCIDKLKRYIPSLSESDLQTILNDIGGDNKSIETQFHSSLVMKTISYQIRYLVATSVQNTKTCKCCMAVLNEDRSCMQCLLSIARGALEDYTKAMRNRKISEESSTAYNGDAHINLTLIGALSLLRVAELGYYGPKTSPLLRLNVQFVLQAVVWLDSCLTEWPKNSPLRMLLVKLYLRLGCVSRAKSLWDKFDVKNAILDPLGVLFYDRISTIAPGFFIHGSPNFGFMNPFSQTYETAIRRTAPRQTLEAFLNQNWKSVFLIHNYAELLKRSCSLVMAIVEERRGMRFRGLKGGISIEDDILVSSINPNHKLVDTTDYTYLPNPGGKRATPTQNLVNYGPGLSHERCHLSLLAERFIDLVNYVQPKEFRACKPGQMMSLDVKYAIKTSIHIGHHMDQFLKDESLLSPAEAFYFNIVSVLSHFVTTFLDTYAVSTSTAHLPKSRAGIESGISMILTILEAQLVNYTSAPSMYHSKIMAFHGFVALHAMGMLRESAIVIRMTASYLTASLVMTSVDKARADKKVLSTGETSWATAQLNKLTALAVKAEKTIEERIGTLKAMVEGGGWIDRLHQWTFDVATARPSSGLSGVPAEVEYREALAAAVKEAVGGDAFFEEWAGHVVDSWRDLIRGWGAVKFG